MNYALKNETVMQSKFKSVCVVCEGVILKGAWIFYDGAAKHVACKPCQHELKDLAGKCMDCEETV